MSFDTNIEYVINSIKSNIDGDITEHNIMTAIMHGIRIVENFVEHDGKTKKKILIKALDALIETELDILKTIIPAAIDSMVYIANIGLTKISNSECCLSCMKE